MQVQNLINDAMLLAGITDGEGNTEGYFFMHKSHIAIVNVVLRDLNALETDIASGNDCVELSKNVLDACIYGIAMWMCKQVGDVNQELFFADTYREKRKSCICDSKKIDVIPRVFVADY